MTFFIFLDAGFNDVILIDSICLLLAFPHLCTAQLCVVEWDDRLCSPSFQLRQNSASLSMRPILGSSLLMGKSVSLFKRLAR